MKRPDEMKSADRDFRYSLIVASVQGEPVVFAVAHQHRRPGYWADRLV
jgi:hypothetical protein